jgi:uncharacterized protein
VSSAGETNAELARAALEAWDRGDIDYALAQLDPEIEVHTAPGLVNSGTYHGIDGFLHWVGAWQEAWETFANTIVRVEALDDHFVVADIEQRGRGAGSGAEVEMRVGYLYEVHDGKCTRFHIYPDWDAAVRAAESLREAERSE